MLNHQQELLQESLHELTNLKSEIKLLTQEVNQLKTTPPRKNAEVRYMLNSLVINISHAEKVIQQLQDQTRGIPILGTAH